MAKKLIPKSAIMLLLAILVCLPLSSKFGSFYLLAFLFEIFMWVALVESWVIMSGFTGYLSLGHAVFFGIGSYTLVHLWNVLPYVGAVLVSGIASAIAALFIGYPFLRVKGPYFVIITLGLTQFCLHMFTSIEIKVAGTLERVIIGGPSFITYYYSLLAVAFAATTTAIYIKRSKFGMALLSIKEDEDASDALGINITFYKLMAFTISAFFPGLVGAVAVLRRSFISPDSVFNPTLSFMVITMALFGGWTRVGGALIGVVILSVLFEFLSVNYPYFYMIISGIIVITVVKFMPGGLLSMFESVFAKRKSLLRRVLTCF